MLSKKVKILSLCVSVLLVASCSEYAKMLRNEDPNERLEYSKKLFEEEKYGKVVKVLEPVYQRFKNTKEGELADWMMAYSWYEDGSYELSAYLMSSFARTYPTSENLQKAAFLSAESAYNLSPDSYLDPEYTTKAISSLQRFIDLYPTSDLIPKADSMVRELNVKLDKKAFDIAYNYYHMEDYSSAVIAFTTILDENPATTYREKILYYRFRAAAIYAYKSIPDLQAERYTEAISYGKSFLRSFPSSAQANEVSTLLQAIENRSAALDVIIKQLSKGRDFEKIKAQKLEKAFQKDEKKQKTDNQPKE